MDDSEVTLNVCLGNQFVGGELFFRGTRCEKHVNTATKSDVLLFFFWVAFFSYNCLMANWNNCFLTKSGDIWLLSCTGASCTSPWTPPPWCQSYNIWTQGQHASMVQKVCIQIEKLASWLIWWHGTFFRIVTCFLSNFSFLLFHSALRLENLKDFRRTSPAGVESALVKSERRKHGRLML